MTLKKHDSPYKNITKVFVKEKIWLEITTLNILPGENVCINLEYVNNRNKGDVILSTTINEEGKALILGNTSKVFTSQTKGVFEEKSIKDIRSNFKKENKILVEEGLVRKGYTQIENGRNIVVNSKGGKGYDWIYGDAPSEALMKNNGMTAYDIKNINLMKFYPTAMLKTAMKTVLWFFSDIEDGLGKNGINLANHFFTGMGRPFVFDSSSNPANEIKDSSRFKDTFLSNLKSELKERYIKKHFINKNYTDNYQISTVLPKYSASEALNLNINEAVAFIGGIQGAIINYQVFKQGEEISIEINRISFLDTFGAGWEDGGAKGVLKQWIPGLVEMFCLQHFKNKNSQQKFQPFMVVIDIEL